VPVVVGASEPLDDSLAIARWAERQGGRALLFGPGLDAAIDEWNQRSESVLSAGRALATRRVAGDAEARREMLPPVIPPRLRGLLLPLADTGVAYLTRKYRLDDTADHVALLAMRRALEASRHAIGVGGGFHLAGRLTYADVAMATALQMVRPPAAPWARLGPASRRCFTHDQLCEEFADLLDWRDDLYGRFRSPGAVQA
jgi:glutathione S-transferase